MGSEVILMGDSGSTMGTSEHFITRHIAGDVEAVRMRLVVALEEMNYRVVTENPLIAKRAARGSGVWGGSTDVLDYPATITIGLKASGRGATRANFDYVVKHPMLSGGDKQTLTREAEAIIALAMRRAPVSCAACGVEIVTESRFCRQCGAPTGAAKPAELEVLRLTAGGRAGYQLTVIALVFLLLALLPPLLPLLKSFPDPARFMRVVRGVIILSGILSGIGFWTLIAGLRRLHLTLNPKGTEEPAIAPRLPGAVRTNELPPAEESPLPGSIVDGTTDLLPLARRSEDIRKTVERAE